MKEFKLRRVEQIYFDDVFVGDQIPPLVKGPFNVMELAKFGAMIGDFMPTHYDHKWATELSRVPGVVVFGLQNMTHMSQLLTDWIGANGILRKFAHRGRAQIYVGDTVTINGEVSKKYLQDGEGYLDCRVWGTNQNGNLVEDGEATVILPFHDSAVPLENYDADIQDMHQPDGGM